MHAAKGLGSPKVGLGAVGVVCGEDGGAVLRSQAAAAVASWQSPPWVAHVTHEGKSGCATARTSAAASRLPSLRWQAARFSRQSRAVWEGRPRALGSGSRSRVEATLPVLAPARTQWRGERMRSVSDALVAWAWRAGLKGGRAALPLGLRHLLYGAQRFVVRCRTGSVRVECTREAHSSAHIPRSAVYHGVVHDRGKHHVYSERGIQVCSEQVALCFGVRLYCSHFSASA